MLPCRKRTIVDVEIADLFTEALRNSVRHVSDPEVYLRSLWSAKLPMFKAILAHVTEKCGCSEGNPLDLEIRCSVEHPVSDSQWATVWKGEVSSPEELLSELVVAHTYADWVPGTNRNSPVQLLFASGEESHSSIRY